MQGLRSPSVISSRHCLIVHSRHGMSTIRRQVPHSLSPCAFLCILAVATQNRQLAGALAPYLEVSGCIAGLRIPLLSTLCQQQWVFEGLHTHESCGARRDVASRGNHIKAS